METIIENNENNQVSVIVKSLDLLKTGPQILAANQQRKDKALSVGRNILQAIQEEGMNAANDERAMKYLSNIGTAGPQMKEDRSGITQIMTQLAKLFTTIENEIDIKTPGTIPAQIQEHRNRYAKDLAAAAEQKRKDAERAADKARESIEIKSSIEVQLSKAYNDYLLYMKQKLQAHFNSITLADYEENSIKLKSYVPCLNKEKFSDLKAAVYAPLHTAEEVGAFTKQTIAEKVPDYISNYATELSVLRDELIDKLPSKLSELQEQKRLADEAAAEEERQRIEKEKRYAEILKATAVKKKQLEEEAEQARIENEKKNAELKKQQEEAAAVQKLREEEEANKLKVQAAESERKSILHAEVKKQGEQTMVLFDQEATLAETTPAPEARQGYEITILHPVGFTQIFAIWFENVGKDLPVDKIGRTSLDQMKSWAEKHAQKTESKIDSKLLKYEPVFRAINKSAKNQ